MCDLRGIPVKPQRKLGKVVRSDREPVKDLSEFLDENHVARYLHHHVQLEIVLSPHQTVLPHSLHDFSPLVEGPAERDHEFHVRQSHLVPDFLHRLALEREACLVFLIVVTGGTPPADHRVFLFRFEKFTAEEVGVLIALEIAHSDDHVVGVESGADLCDTLRQLVDEEIGFVLVSLRQVLDLFPDLRIGNFIELNEGQGV